MNYNASKCAKVIDSGYSVHTFEVPFLSNSKHGLGYHPLELRFSHVKTYIMFIFIPKLNNFLLFLDPKVSFFHIHFTKMNMAQNIT